jgi:hypothetical protein
MLGKIIHVKLLVQEECAFVIWTDLQFGLHRAE